MLSWRWTLLTSLQINPHTLGFPCCIIFTLHVLHILKYCPVPSCVRDDLMVFPLLVKVTVL